MKDRYIILFLILVTFSIFIPTLGEIGICIDEPPYFYAGDTYLSWYKTLISKWKEGNFLYPFQKSVIDHYFEYNHEHPPFAMLVYGITNSIFKNILGPVEGYRAGTLLFYIILIPSLYYLLKGYGKIVPVFALFSLILIPQFYGLSHLAVLDFPHAAFHVAIIYAFIRGIESPKWSIIMGVLWGFDLITKINSFFVPIPLFIWGFFYYKKKVLRNLIVFALISPIIMFLFWPWLWHDTFERIRNYLFFHTHHDFHPTYYFGKVYKYPPAPWHFPLIIELITTPLVTLTCFFVGLYSILRKKLKDKIGILLILNFIFTILPLMLPSTPVYDGTRLFLAGTIFLSMIAGIGFKTIINIIPLSFFQKRFNLEYVKLILIILFLIPSVISIISISPYEMSYYNTLIGGVKGAFKVGMEATFWGETINKSVVEYINKTFPYGATIDINSEAYRILSGYQRLGLLRKDIILTENAQYWIFSNQQGYSDMNGWWELYYDRHPNYKLIKSFGIDGVNLVMIYKKK